MWLYFRLFLIGLRLIGCDRRDLVVENLVLRQQFECTTSIGVVFREEWLAYLLDFCDLLRNRHDRLLCWNTETCCVCASPSFLIMAHCFSGKHAVDEIKA